MNGQEAREKVFKIISVEESANSSQYKVHPSFTNTKWLKLKALANETSAKLCLS